MRFPSDPLGRRRLARLRLAAQMLTRAQAASPAEAVRSMLAMQGQDYPGAKWSIGLRSSSTEAEVEAALDAGEIVRSWPMRGTLHLTAAEDLPWMLSLTASRAMAGAAQRRAMLGITVDELEQARDLAIEALPGRTTRTRGGCSRRSRPAECRPGVSAATTSSGSWPRAGRSCSGPRADASRR